MMDKSNYATLIDPYYNNQQGWLWQKNEPKSHHTQATDRLLRSLTLTPIKSETGPRCADAVAPLLVEGCKSEQVSWLTKKHNDYKTVVWCLTWGLNEVQTPQPFASSKADPPPRKEAGCKREGQ